LTFLYISRHSKDHVPSFGSETINEADFSSRPFSREASFAETFPSTMAEMLSRASAVFSNLENVFNRRLSHVSDCEKTRDWIQRVKRTYIEVAFSTEARSSASVFVFLMALSFALNIAYPAAVSASMKTIVSCGEMRAKKRVGRKVQMRNFSVSCTR
jgi:hypothetical protein